MIDLRDLRREPEPYRRSVAERGLSVDIDRLLQLDSESSQLTGAVDELRSQLNVRGKPEPEELKRLQEVKGELEIKEVALNSVETELNDLLWAMPNLMAPDTPEGGEEANRSQKTWGEAVKSDAKDHLTWGEERDWIDFERGAKVAGNKFYYLKGPLVRLEIAVMHFAMDLLEAEGFTLMTAPHLVNRRVFEGSGFQARGDEQQYYQIEGEDLRLIGTAEISLAGYHADEIIPADRLPLAYAALTPSYRREAGAYGKHARGLFRVHQFDKLEMFVFSQSAESEAWQQKLLDLEERIVQALAIPYRIVRIAAGDLGAPAYKKYDLEYWSPVEGTYRELTSCSNCTDFQARRLAIRTRNGDGKPEFVHTLNGTAVAFSRVPAAIIENQQTADGQIRVPAALVKYYGKEVL